MAGFNLKILTLILCLIPAFSSFAIAQDAKDDEPIKVDTLLLNIPVIASDREGRNIAGLKKEDFIVTHNGIRQSIDFFADEEAPMNVAIVIDLSISTRFVLKDIKEAAKEFVEIFRPEDKGMIVGFSFETSILSELTSDKKQLKKAINDASLAPFPGLRMHDALYQLVTKDLAAIKGRKAIIVLTDGMVGGSISDLKLMDTVIESDVLIYPIFFQTTQLFPPDVKKVTFDQLVNTVPINFLYGLTLATGGRFYPANGTKFKEAFRSIADELKKQYLVGFYPPPGEPGKRSEVRITAERKDIALRTKRIIRLKRTQ